MENSFGDETLTPFWVVFPCLFGWFVCEISLLICGKGRSYHQNFDNLRNVISIFKQLKIIIFILTMKKI